MSAARSKRRTGGTAVVAALGATLALVRPCALARPPAPLQPPAQPPAGEVIPAGQLEVARLVDLAAERLHIAIEYDAATLKGAVTMRLPTGLSDQELWELTNRALAARGFTTVRAARSGGMSVVRLSDAKTIAELRELDETAPDPSAPPSPGMIEPGFTSVLVRLKHRAAKDIVEAVKLVLSKDGGAASALADSGLVMVSDLSPRVAHALTVIASLDTASGASVEEITTRFLSPAQLAALVQQVAAKRAATGGELIRGEVLASPNASAVLVIAPPESQGYWRDLVTRLDKREPVSAVTYAPRFFSAREVAKLVEQAVKEGPAAADDRFRVVTDDLTGSLIVTATPTQQEKVAELVRRLDSVSAGARRPVRTFVIRNRPVTDVLAVVEQLMQTGALSSEADTGLASSQARPPTPAASSLQSSPPPPFSPASSPTPAAPADSSPHQESPEPSPASSRPPTAGAGPASGGAPLELTADTGTNSIIAVGEPGALAQLEALLASLDVRQPQVLLEVMLVSLTEAQGLQLGVEIEKLTSIDGTIIRLASLFGLSTGAAGGIRAVGDAAGFTGTALNPGDLNIVVRALQNMNNGRSLSAPQVLVNNNQQAVLSSVLQQPFAQTNASNTVATTSFGGTQDAGTTLTIRPQIAEGDHLVLQYSVALSSFVGSASNAALPPPRQQNTVQSTVTIPDGYTVVVGGLELETDTKAVSQVPLLGDIPVVGELFKNRDNNHSKTRFFVFIRAGVLRAESFEDLKYVSEARSSAMFVDDGFPEVEPMLIR